MSRLKDLTEAMRTWERGEASAALATLVELWREVKWPVLGDVICSLTVEAGKQRAPIRPTGQQSGAEVWREVEAQRDPLDLPRLLEPMPKATTKLQFERVTAMEQWPTHPFLTRTIVGWWEHFFVTVHVAQLAGVLERNADPAVSARLATLAPTPKKATKWVGRHNAPRLVELAGKSASWSAPPCSDEEAAVIGQLARMISKDTVSSPDELGALFAKVYARPDDDAVRALVADALVSRADPRGEFISLQLMRGAAAPTKRERQLEDEWRDTWLGRLAPCFRKGVRFVRGFPAEGAYEKGGEASWPEWATFEALDLFPASGFIGGGAPLLVHGRFPLLRKVVGLGRPALDLTSGVNLLSLSTVPWTTLGVQCAACFLDVADTLFTAARFPAVEALELGPVPGWGAPAPTLVERVMTLPWFRQVKRLDVCAAPVGVVSALHSKVDVVTVRDPTECSSSTWQPSTGALTLSIDRVTPRAADLLVLVLREVPTASIREVTLSVPRCKRDGTELSSGSKRVDVEPLLRVLESLKAAKVSLPW